MVKELLVSNQSLREDLNSADENNSKLKMEIGNLIAENQDIRERLLVVQSSRSLQDSKTMLYEESQAKKGILGPRICISPKGQTKPKGINILNDFAAFKANKLQSIAMSRPTKENDFSPSLKQRRKKETLRRYDTNQEDHSPAHLRLYHSVESKRDDSKNLYNLRIRPRRSRTDVKDNQTDDFGDTENFQITDDRMEYLNSPVNPNQFKNRGGGKNRYNLRPVGVQHIKSLHLE